MTTNQEGRQAAIRDSTSTAYGVAADWHALFDDAGIGAGTFNERLLAWINAELSASHSNLVSAMQAYAEDAGYDGWEDMATLVLAMNGAETLLDGETQGLAFDFTDQSALIIDTGTPANNYDSTGIVSSGSLVGPSGKLTYTSPSNKLTLQSDGYYKYQAHNLLIYSNDFNNAAWTKYTAETTVTTGAATNPYGRSADLLVDDGLGGATAQLRIERQVTTQAGASIEFSVVAKKALANGTWLRLSEADTGRSCYFDLENGVKGTETGGTVGAITEIANGWYKCTLTVSVTADSTPRCNIFVAEADNDVSITTCDGTYGIYISDGHCRRTPSNSDFIQTSASAVYALPLEYSATDGSCLGLLVEEQRTNILLQSQDAATTWGATQLTVTANDTTAPTGEATGDRLTEAATTNFHFIAQSGLSITASTNYTMSVFVKDGTRRYVQLAFDDGSSGPHATYDLSSVAVTETGSHGAGGSYVSSSITAVGNGWYRLSLTGTVGGSTGDRALVLLAPSATPGWAPSYAGNTGNYLYVWGMQLEAGSFPTSPVVTYGAAATRNADNISIARTATPLPGMATASSGEVVSGAMYFKTPAQTSVTTYVLDLAYDSNDRVRFRWGAGGAGTMAIEGATTDAGGAGIVGSGAMDADTDGSVAFRWAEDATAYSYSKVGTAQDEDTLCDVLGNAWSNIVIGQNFGSTIQKIVLVPSNWNNATLETKVGK